MKKSIIITLFLCGIVLGSTCYAEQPVHRHFDSSKKFDSIIVVDEAIGTTRQTFKYDANDLLVEETFCDLDDDGTIAFGTRSKYNYNEEGQISEKWTYEYLSNNWLSKEQYIYNGNNLSQKVNGDVILAEYQYDEDNNLIESVEGFNKTIFVYDGRIKVEQIVFSLHDDTWVPFEKTTYRYEGKNLVEETLFVIVDKKWHEKNRNIYSYNKNNQLTQKRHEEWGEEGEKVKEIVTYEYVEFPPFSTEIIEKINDEVAISTTYYFR